MAKKKEGWKLVKTAKGYRYTDGKGNYKLRRPGITLKKQQLAPGVTKKQASAMDAKHRQKNYNKRTNARNQNKANLARKAKVIKAKLRGYAAKTKKAADKRLERMKFDAAYDAKRVKRQLTKVGKFLSKSPTQKMKEHKQKIASHTGMKGPTLHDLMPSNPQLKSQKRRKGQTIANKGGSAKPQNTKTSPVKKKTTTAKPAAKKPATTQPRKKVQQSVTKPVSVKAPTSRVRKSQGQTVYQPASYTPAPATRKPSTRSSSTRSTTRSSNVSRGTRDYGSADANMKAWAKANKSMIQSSGTKKQRELLKKYFG